MPSKPAIIRQRDLTRIVKGYAAAGISVRTVIEAGRAYVEPVPANDVPAVIPSDKTGVDDGKDWHL